MRITFVKPNIGRLEHSLYVDEGRMEPLQLGVLAGLTPAGVECVLHDDRLEAIPYDDPTDLAAITVDIFTARRAYEIAAEYRQRGVPVVLGGFHPSLHPEECQRHADAVVIGDAEPVWHTVVEDAARRRLRPVYHSRPGVAQSGSVLPRRDLFRGKGYLPVTLIQFSRGCRFQCEFCAISVYFGRRNFVRESREVLEEIQSQDRRVLFFVDDNFLSDHAAAKRFLKELIPLRVRWVSQASLDMTTDPELMDLIEASGCLGTVIGFESLDPRNLRLMKKRPNLVRVRGSDGSFSVWDRYERPIQILRSHHLQTWAAFTLGHDEDTAQSIRETCEFAVHHKFCFAAFNILMPYPGTPFYERLKAQRRLLYDGVWWLHPEYRFNHAAFVPRHMSPSELTEACWDCRRRWNSLGSIFRRMWDHKTHLHSLTRLVAYLAYNPLYARESLRKQGMLFGLHRGRPDRLPSATLTGNARERLSDSTMEAMTAISSPSEDRR